MPNVMSPSESGERTRPRKRPDRLDPDDERGRLRAGFIRLYLQDQGFRRALRRLAKRKGDVVAFCDRWGLTFRDNQAEEAVRLWCEDHCRNKSIPTDGLLSYFTWGGFRPIDQGCIFLRFIWDPTEESRTDAEARLRNAMEQRLKAALDDIAKGYHDFPEPSRQRSPRRAKHLRWLFERQRFERSYAAIAEDAAMVEAPAVRLACERLAKKIDLEIREIRSPSRKKIRNHKRN